MSLNKPKTSYPVMTKLDMIFTLLFYSNITIYPQFPDLTNLSSVFDRVQNETVHENLHHSTSPSIVVNTPEWPYKRPTLSSYQNSVWVVTGQ